MIKLIIGLNKLRKNTDSNKKINQVIVGNKIDLQNERQITKEEGEKMAVAYSLKYFETSAKENIGINEFMLSIINDIFNDEKNKEMNKNIELEKHKDEETNKGCMC